MKHNFIFFLEYSSLEIAVVAWAAWEIWKLRPGREDKAKPEAAPRPVTDGISPKDAGHPEG